MRAFLAGIMFVLMLWLASGQAEGGLNDGLAGWWNLDGNGDDSSGNMNNGTVIGAVPTQDRFGYANSALLFDGNSSYVTIPDAPDLRPSNAITFTAWFKPTAFNLGTFSWPAVLKKAMPPNQGDGYGMETLFVYESRPEMSAVVVLPSALPQAHLPMPTDPTDKWYFAAGVYDGSQVSLYLYDGQSWAVNSQNGSGNIQNSLGELWIGADPSNPGSARSFNGAIDDVRIWDRALSAEEIIHVSPEPSTLVLLCIGTISLLAYAWRRPVA